MGYLIRAGADVSHQDGDLYTPLHYAVRFRQPVEGIEDLRAAGADREARDKKERTPADHDHDHRYPSLHN